MSNQQGSYLAPPGRQPPRRYAVPVTIAIVLGVIGAVALAVIGKGNRDHAGDAAGAQPSGQLTPSTPATGPVVCRLGRVATCFPKATVASVSAVLESRGAACRQAAGWTIVCHQGSDPSIDLTLMSVPGQPDKLEGFSATTRSADAGGRVLVEKNLRAWLPTILSALLPGETGTQQRISAWLPKDFGLCPSGGQLTDRYRVGCRIPALKDEFGRVSTSWSTDITIYPDY